jgi:hypothetical protein
MHNEEMLSTKSINLNLENRLGKLQSKLSHVEPFNKLESSLNMMEKLKILEEEIRNS